MASRILGMGDVVGLMQDFEEVVDQKKAEEDAARMLAGRLHARRLPRADPDDPEDGIAQGPRRQAPGIGGMLPEPDVNLDDSELVRIEAMIQSMTRFEKQRPLRARPRAEARRSASPRARAARARR